MARILDGAACAKRIREQIKSEVQKLKIEPGLAVVLVGNNPASKIYVARKSTACKEAGFFTKTIQLPEKTKEKEVVEKIRELNADSRIHGILIQLPLPKQINVEHVLEAVEPTKDVDGFHSHNRGLLFSGTPRFVPCTPLGIMKLLEHYRIPVESKRAVVIGRSMTVGKPMAALLLHADATVTICHSKTKNMVEHTRNADILIVAAGKRNVVTEDMINRKGVIIDVGIHRDGGICGDVDEQVKQKAAAYSPVPGGVGPMTIAMLLYNTLHAAKMQKNIMRGL